MKVWLLMLCSVVCWMASPAALASPVAPVGKVAEVSASDLRKKITADDHLAEKADIKVLRSLAGKSGVGSQRSAVLTDLRAKRIELAALKRGASPWDRPITLFRPGAIGAVYPIQVFQILSPSEALVNVAVPFERPRRHAVAGGANIPIPNSAPTYIETFRGVQYDCSLRLVMMKGWDFSALTNKSYLTISGLCRVGKSVTYATAAGSNTVSMITPLRVVEPPAKKKPR